MIMETQNYGIKQIAKPGLVLAFFLTAVLMMVWPMPGTIALRNSVLLLLGVFVLLGVWRNTAKGARLIRLPRLPLYIYLTLTAWIVVVILLWSHEPKLSWKEFPPQWLLPMVSGLIAWSLVCWSAVNQRQQGLMLTLFYTLLAAVLIQNCMGAVYFLETGAQPFRQASVLYIPRLLEGMPWQQAFDGNFGEKFSFVNNMFVAFVLAEIGQRLLTHKRWLQIPNWLLGFSLLAAVLCSYWLSFRNGNIGLLSLAGFFGVLLIFAHKDRFRLWQKCLLVCLLGAALAGLAYLFVKSDPRWQTFKESAVIAIEGDPGKAWLLRKDYPLLSNGQPVEGSAYERISWIKEGVKLSLRYPMGTGFNRNAFSDTLDRDYQLNGLIRGGHSHSGIVDFMIANGIPGAILWLAFLASCAWVGWGMVRQGNVAQGLTVVFLVTGFFNRGMVDSNIRDHVLQQFLFLLTIYLTIQLAPVSPVNHSKTNHEAAA
jgi:O-Antigen ligase